MRVKGLSELKGLLQNEIIQNAVYELDSEREEMRYHCVDSEGTSA